MCHTRVTYLDTEGVNDVETVNVIGGGAKLDQMTHEREKRKS